MQPRQAVTPAARSSSLPTDRRKWVATLAAIPNLRQPESLEDSKQKPQKLGPLSASSWPTRISLQFLQRKASHETQVDTKQGNQTNPKPNHTSNPHPDTQAESSLNSRSQDFKSVNTSGLEISPVHPRHEIQRFQFLKS